MRKSMPVKHIYTFAFVYPEKHPINGDGARNKHLVSIEVAKDMAEIGVGESCAVDIHHGATPSAPTIMTRTSGIVRGEEKRVILESTFLQLKFSRVELSLNPMPWKPIFEGERHETPIYHDVE